MEKGVQQVNSAWEKVAEKFKVHLEALDLQIKEIINSSKFAAAYDAITKAQVDSKGMSTRLIMHGDIKEHPDVAFLIGLQTLRSNISNVIETKGASEHIK